MPFSRKTLQEKPYNRCINCIHIGELCDGPNFLAMEIERWCEWCRLRKEYLGWTNLHVAELADVSKISVDRIMRVDIKDLRISTMQAVTKALINGTWGKYPCVLAATETLDTAECSKLRDEIERLKADHSAEIEALKASEETKVKYLKEQVQFLEDQIRSKDMLIKHMIDSTKK